MVFVIKCEVFFVKFWKVFDDLDDFGILEEIGEERREYDELVRNEIDWKIQLVFKFEGFIIVVYVMEILMDDDFFIEYDICLILLFLRVVLINVVWIVYVFFFVEFQLFFLFYLLFMGKMFIF